MHRKWIELLLKKIFIGTDVDNASSIKLSPDTFFLLTHSRIQNSAAHPLH